MTETSWIEHDGNGMPVEGHKLVAVKFMDDVECGITHPSPAEYWQNGTNDGDTRDHWTRCGDDEDIVFYKVIEID